MTPLSGVVTAKLNTAAAETLRSARGIFTVMNYCNPEWAGNGQLSDGDIKTFGKLMNQSCKSSIEQYECGVPAVCDLQQVVSGADGVYGSRFMGGGFGGCVVGLVRSSRATVAAEEIETAYKKLHPEVADQAFVKLSRSDDGVRFL